MAQIRSFIVSFLLLSFIANSPNTSPLLNIGFLILQTMKDQVSVSAMAFYKNVQYFTIYNSITLPMADSGIDGPSAYKMCKIVLPHKLRYLENMLNAEVIAKAAKLRQRMEANPNIQDSEKSWPLLLAKFQADENKNIIPSYPYKNMYARRIPNLK